MSQNPPLWFTLQELRHHLPPLAENERKRRGWWEKSPGRSGEFGGPVQTQVPWCIVCCCLRLFRPEPLSLKSPVLCWEVSTRALAMVMPVGGSREGYELQRTRLSSVAGEVVNSKIRILTHAKKLHTQPRPHVWSLVHKEWMQVLAYNRTAGAEECLMSCKLFILINSIRL